MRLTRTRMLVIGQSRLTGVRLPTIKAPLRRQNPDSVTNVRELAKECAVALDFGGLNSRPRTGSLLLASTNARAIMSIVIERGAPSGGGIGVGIARKQRKHARRHHPLVGGAALSLQR